MFKFATSKLNFDTFETKFSEYILTLRDQFDLKPLRLEVNFILNHLIRGQIGLGQFDFRSLLPWTVRLTYLFWM